MMVSMAVRSVVRQVGHRQSPPGRILRPGGTNSSSRELQVSFPESHRGRAEVTGILRPIKFAVLPAASASFEVGFPTHNLPWIAY